MKEAIGIIETNGFVAAIGALDGMLKAANVELIGYKKKLGASLVSITILGDVGAVHAAIGAGRSVGEEIGEVVATHIIPRVSKDVAQVFELNATAMSKLNIAKTVAPSIKYQKDKVKKEKNIERKKPVTEVPTKQKSVKKTMAKKKEK